LTSSDLARRILTRDTPGPEDDTGTGAPERAILALERACTRVTDPLRSAMGDAGCAALFARALARTERAHPALKDLPSGEQRIGVDDLAASVAAHGIENVTAAIEALIAALIDILTRLIGDDMAMRLLDHDSPQPPTRSGGREP
jgi:hypothetical protein